MKCWQSGFTVKLSIFPHYDTDEWQDFLIVDPSDKILNAGRIDFILRPVLEEDGLDGLEEVVFVDGDLDFIVGGKVGCQFGQILSATERVSVS